MVAARSAQRNGLSFLASFLMVLLVAEFPDDSRDPEERNYETLSPVQAFPPRSSLN